MPGPIQKDHLHLGAILFPGIDQADFTTPYEVLASVPNSTFHVLGREKTPVQDTHGLILTPEIPLAEAPQLDLLLVPGGAGVNALMEDEVVLAFVRRQAAGAKVIFSVCTGALVLGAAGLLKGRKATTHWASHHLLSSFGARPVNARVVVDGNVVTAAGVTSGLDGALRVVALLRGETAGQMIQLYTQYAPEPPFNCGTPESAAPELVRAVQSHLREVLEARRAIVKRVVAKPGW